MDGYTGYNQILINHEDQEATSFYRVGEYKNVYCYKVMSFGLKNARATKQRLVIKMFWAKECQGHKAKACHKDV